jgi:hypothetical protein
MFAEPPGLAVTAFHDQVTVAGALVPLPGLVPVMVGVGAGPCVVIVTALDVAVCGLR